MPLAFSIARISTSTMSGRQAKLLSDQHLTNLLRFAQASRYPARNRLIVLLSFKAGLRAAEIANLTWAMVVDATGAVAPVIELHDQAAKNGGGRRIPVHPDLYTALSRWRDLSPPSDFVISSERGRRDATTKHRELVCASLSLGRPGRLLVPFRPPHLHHPGRPAGPQGRWLAPRCAAVGRSSVDADNPAVHRRRHRCSAQARIADLNFDGCQSHHRSGSGAVNDKTNRVSTRLLSIMPFA